MLVTFDEPPNAVKVGGASEALLHKPMLILKYLTNVSFYTYQHKFITHALHCKYLYIQFSTGWVERKSCYVCK